MVTTTTLHSYSVDELTDGFGFFRESAEELGINIDTRRRLFVRRFRDYVQEGLREGWSITPRLEIHGPAEDAREPLEFNFNQLYAEARARAWEEEDEFYEHFAAIREELQDKLGQNHE